MLQRIKLLLAANKAAAQYLDIRKEIDTMKNPFLSKTVWFNLAHWTLTIAGFLPAKYALTIGAVGNIVLRAVTNQPLNLPWKTE